MGVVQLPLRHRATLVERHDPIGLRRDRHAPQRRSFRLQRQQGLARGAVVEVHLAGRIGGREALLALRRADVDDGPLVPLELVDPCQTPLAASRRRNDLPGRDPAGPVADDEGPVADEEAERRHRSAATGGDVRDLDPGGVGRVAQVVADHLAPRGSDEQVLGASVQRELRDLSVDLQIECLPRLLAGARADQGLLLDRRLHHQLRGTHLRDRDRTGAGDGGGQGPDRPLPRPGRSRKAHRRRVSPPRRARKPENVTANFISRGITRPSDVPMT